MLPLTIGHSWQISFRWRSFLAIANDYICSATNICIRPDQPWRINTQTRTRIDETHTHEIITLIKCMRTARGASFLFTRTPENSRLCECLHACLQLANVFVCKTAGISRIFAVGPPARSRAKMSRLHCKLSSCRCDAKAVDSAVGHWHVAR